MEAKTKTENGVKVVRFSGRICVGPALDRFNTTLVELLNAGHNRVVLNLEAVPAIDSSGIGMLVRYLTKAKQGGGTIGLLKPSKFLLQTLKMVGLLNLFQIFDDEMQAIESLSRV